MYPVFARLTLARTKEEVLEHLRSLPARYAKAIVCEEDATRHHLHLLALTPETNSKNQRQNLRNFLKKGFPELIEDSNLYSISKVYTEGYDKMGTYIVKDGNYCYYGFTIEEVSVFKETSFPKKTKESYKQDLIALEASFFSNQIPTEDFMNQFYDIRIKYNKPLSYYQALNYFQFIFMKQNPAYRFRQMQRLAIDLRIDAFENE